MPPHPATDAPVHDPVSGELPGGAVAAQPEGLTNLLDFVNESVELPQGGVAGLVAETRTKLVVVVLDARVREITVAGLKVLVRAPWSAMKQEHF